VINEESVYQLNGVTEAVENFIEGVQVEKFVASDVVTGG
jgi:hypothetical protein